MSKILSVLALAILLMTMPVVSATFPSNQERIDARWEEIRSHSRERLGVNHIWFNDLRCYVWNLQIEALIKEQKRYGLSNHESIELSNKQDLFEQHC